MAVGDAADPGEQRDVVQRNPLGFVEAHPFAEPGGDAPRAQHVLHRLAETEIGTERERGDELRQPELPIIDTRHRLAAYGPSSARLSGEYRTTARVRVRTVATVVNSATQVDGRIAAEPVRWSIAGAFLESLTARDYGRLASTLAPRVRFRALQNEGPLEWHGRAEVAEVFRSWFGDADWFEVVDATIGGIAARLQMTWRIRLRPAPFDI